ncbi:MAG: hypothetical protein U0W24_11240 [Bacteroidales bacterium]
MNKNDLLKVLEDYSGKASRNVNERFVLDLLKKHNIIKEEGKSSIETLHWNSAAYSFLNIPKEISQKYIKQDFLEVYKLFKEKEGKLLENIREYHLKLLLKIIANEVDI